MDIDVKAFDPELLSYAMSFNFYRVLGLKDKASPEQIETAVRRKMKLISPQSPKMKFWNDFIPNVFLPAKPDYDDLLDAIKIKYRGRRWKPEQFEIDFAIEGERRVRAYVEESAQLAEQRR